MLHVALAAVWEAPADRRPAVVDHAVRTAKALTSLGEAKLVNALLRRAVREGPPPAPAPTAPLAAWATWTSHPEWLVARWEQQFGRAATLDLLAWNQQPAPTYVCFPAGRPSPLPNGLSPTSWPHYARFDAGTTSPAVLLQKHRDAFVQDPGQRHAVGLLKPPPGAAVLDLGAAPGGKALALAAAVGPAGRVVAVDRVPDRVALIAQNRDRAGVPWLHPLVAEIASLNPAELAAAGHPESYGHVLLDAPCSNTGVLARRPDVKDRLTPDEPSRQAAIQAGLLAAAARFVAPGGTLVYSTCSLEAEENEGVIETFLRAHSDFRLHGSQRVFPPRDGCDGAAAFRLVRAG